MCKGKIFRNVTYCKQNINKNIINVLSKEKVHMGISMDTHVTVVRI